MSPRAQTVVDGPEFADILPGVADPEHYQRLVPTYARSWPEVDQAEAVVADLEHRLSTLDERRAAALSAGDRDALLGTISEATSLPVELHAARIHAADVKAERFHSEAARVDDEASVLAEPAQRVIRLQAAVLHEAAKVRQACNVAESVSSIFRDEASRAESEAARLRRVDPTREALYVAGPKVEPSASPDPGPTVSIWKTTVNGRGDIVAINGRALTQADADGRDKREDGYRLRVDGVLIDDNDQPVKDKSGRVRQFLSAIRR